jgi:hypothetical protein
MNVHTVKQLKKAQSRTVQQRAFNDLLLRKHVNGGTLQFGDMQKLINNYNSMGFNEWTTSN